MSDWNAKQYSKFKKERTLPAIELANAIECDDVKSVIDIGCGIGNSTAVLKRKYKDARVIGADNSKDMLESARQNNSDIEFIELDAEKELSNLNERFDIVFSNACIQWIPDHKRLLGQMFSCLAPRGVLAVQIPEQAKHPVHKIIREVSDSEKWREKLNFRRSYNNLTEEEYFDVLSELTDDFRIWETTYFHAMPSYESIIEWYRGTGLRPYLERLSDVDQAEFTLEIKNNLERIYPIQKNGEIIFRFPRLFFTARKTN